MKRQSTLRIGRIIISVAIAAALTALWTEYADADADHPLHWIEKTQIVVAGTAIVSVVQLMFWLIVSSVFGRVYCSGFCPLGVWFDVMSRLGRYTRRRLNRPCRYAYTRPLNRLRLTLLATAIACVAAGLTLLPRLIEPTNIWHAVASTTLRPLRYFLTSTSAQHIAAYSVTGASLCAMAIALVVLIAVSIPAWKNGRIYCNTVCPIGTALSLTSRHALWRIDIDTDICTGCGRCADICKSGCIDLNDHAVDMSRCVNCFDCLSQCPDDAIFYRPTRKQLSWPLLQDVNPTVETETSMQSPKQQTITSTDK